MLKYINYQLEPDDKAQASLEQNITPQIHQRFKDNLSAFSHFMPSVVSLIEQHTIQQYSIFCTRKGELNIVDFATGRVWYSDTPFNEVADEVAEFCQQAPFITMHSSREVTENTWLSEPLPASVNVIIMFGLGLGYQLNELLQNTRVKYLIVYEPSLDTLIASAQANNWLELFETAAALGTQVFLQLGKNGSSVTEDIAELLAVTKIDHIYVYRHRFHPVMDEVIDYLFLHSGDKKSLTNSHYNFDGYNNFYDYVAERNNNVLGNKKSSECEAESTLYQRNITALKRFYPNVYQEIIKHHNKHWQLCLDEQQCVNLFHTKRKAFFYQNIDAESQQLVDYFIRHPYKDDVVVGQGAARKLKHYLHFTHVAQIRPLIKQQLQQRIQLPQQVDSLIIFGVALGRHIELLTQQRDIANLYICEPNLDFFAASLHVTNWASIFERADANQQRIYLNLGGDGLTYFNDLMTQFYQVGAYSIANTYMLSSYFNNNMQKAISNLRAEFRVVLALGEYYDNARYGIAHTYNSIKQGHKFLKLDNKEYKNNKALDFPVFIVGNGPSLDQSFDYLRQYRDQVILISCGTALYSLYKQGIKPDFHAEIEQNRSTYFWVSQVDDKAWLKDINLISVNGIHPDTADLFKDTFLCFKSGEASTHIFQTDLHNQGYVIADLSYAYPTVTNLVVNYMLQLGSKVMYLFGVDLGYIDIRYHHSQASAYYRQDGSEIYNYQNVHGGGIPIKGNFLPMVFTKPEFDVSRKLLEQAIASAAHKIEIYNCSNGVRIDGAIALAPENILLESNLADKNTILPTLLEQAYYVNLSQYADSIHNKFDMTTFTDTIESWLLLFDKDVNSRTEAKEFLESQWQLLKRKSAVPSDPTFCLFFGSTNYFAGIMTKLVSCISDNNSEDVELLNTFNQIKMVWRNYIATGYQQYKDEPLKFDDVDVGRLFK
ncbi:6-hydroxymethylpterin diphosphokinase MptE-like protein [Rheinheimera metallidurans]|uniref:motility associated factor glycosyltransferase family protein n=1 Tax=Rheinheimera metallidurans TaxID=2925781 RepID=UPI0030035542